MTTGQTSRSARKVDCGDVPNLTVQKTTDSTHTRAHQTDWNPKKKISYLHENRSGKAAAAAHLTLVSVHRNNYNVAEGGGAAELSRGRRYNDNNNTQHAIVLQCNLRAVSAASPRRIKYKIYKYDINYILSLFTYIMFTVRHRVPCETVEINIII